MLSTVSHYILSETQPAMTPLAKIQLGQSQPQELTANKDGRSCWVYSLGVAY